MEFSSESNETNTLMMSAGVSRHRPDELFSMEYNHRFHLILAKESVHNIKGGQVLQESLPHYHVQQSVSKYNQRVNHERDKSESSTIKLYFSFSGGLTSVICSLVLSALDCLDLEVDRRS